MGITKIMILGAGPAGLSAALALSKVSTASAPLEIHLFELRPSPQPLGSSVNLTPLAMRYLDHLGAGTRLRQRSSPVRAVDIVSMRTGRYLGSMWGGVDAIRARRADLVDALLEVLRENAPNVCLRMGMRVVAIRELSGSDTVALEFEGGEIVEGDLVLGCDGLHSAVRTLYVDSDRPKRYTGKAVAHGIAKLKTEEQTVLRLADGSPALRDTVVLIGGRGALLATYFEPSRRSVCLTAVTDIPEAGHEPATGWRALARDQDAIKRDVDDLFRTSTSGVQGLTELVDRCDRWNLLPVYTLPLEGVWRKGRVLLLGDAAHAMPPQGESAGVAIEDGVLIARVLERRGERDIDQLLADYEKLRRPVINDLYRRSVARGFGNTKEQTWLQSVLTELIAIIFLFFMNWWKRDYFARDVRNLPLPK